METLNQTNSTELSLPENALENTCDNGQCLCEHNHEVVTTTALELTPEGKAAAESVDAQPVPQVWTRKMIGQWRRANVTVTHGTVRACEHKASFSATQMPKTNCVDCWVAYFSTCVDLLSIHKLMADKGVKGLERAYGTKFVKNFRGYLAMYLKEQKEEPTQEEVTI
jgi:hypothetical protein